MTKKDYELFANEINKNYVSGNVNVLENLIDCTARVFRADNCLFNEEKYRTACRDGKHIRKSIKQ